MIVVQELLPKVAKGCSYTPIPSFLYIHSGFDLFPMRSNELSPLHYHRIQSVYFKTGNWQLTAIEETQWQAVVTTEWLLMLCTYQIHDEDFIIWFTQLWNPTNRNWTVHFLGSPSRYLAPDKCHWSLFFWIACIVLMLLHSTHVTVQCLLCTCDCTAAAVHMWLCSCCCAHVTAQPLLCTYHWTAVPLHMWLASL